jgi:hypothetical protein
LEPQGQFRLIFKETVLSSCYHSVFARLQGQDPSAFQSGNPADSDAGAPPPPGPPPPPFDSSKEVATSSPAGPGAFLSQINQGAGVTSKLKKVDPSQQTHKNPELRAGSIVTEKGELVSSGSAFTLRLIALLLGSAAPAPPTKPKPSALTQKRPAETRLDGTKWIVVSTNSVGWRERPNSYITVLARNTTRTLSTS